MKAILFLIFVSAPIIVLAVVAIASKKDPKK